MQIIYDAQIFLNQKAGGVSRYHYELFDGLKKSGNNAEIVGLFVKNQYLLSNPRYRKNFIYDPMAIFAAMNKMILKQALKKVPSDAVFHPANPYHFLREEFAVVRHKIFTVHDMIVEKQNLSLGQNKLFFAQNANKIIAVSETTKKDIIRFFDIDKEKVEVIYHGSSLCPQMAKKPRQIIPDTYLLYVGDRGGYKNFTTLVGAIAGLLKEHSNLYLVCAGKRPFDKREKSLLKELNITQKVLFFPKTTDKELAYLYCHAAAFVFPSLFEGFGIPILEAWSCGTPVVLSHNDCFIEIAAESAYYFNPLSEDSINESVKKVLFDKNLQKELIKKGNERLTQFSWEKTVKQTQKLYKSIL